MKPIQLALGIAGSAVIIGVVVAVSNAVRLRQDGAEITKLIAEYKAMGVPTNGDELVQKIPDRENAWIEIEPYLVERTKGGARILFKSGVALELLMTCGKKDLPLIDKYLAENKPKRDAIDAALAAKAKLQVPHDYDEGYMMLLPEFAAIRPLVREYCLAAFAAGLRGDIDGAERNLESANRFASNCIGRPEYIAAVSGASHRQLIYATVLRIVEAYPSASSRLQAYISSPQFQTAVDQKKVLSNEFVAQLTIPRRFDSPEIDRPQLPDFMKGFVKVSDASGIEALAHTRHGDYMPESMTMRSFLRKRLEAWKPFFKTLRGPQMPSVSEYVAASEMNATIPKKLTFLMPETSTDESLIYRGLGMAQKYVDINRALWLAMNKKARTGHFPETLEEIGVPFSTAIPGDTISYEATRDHILISGVQGTKYYDDSMPGLSFPATIAIQPKSMAEFIFRAARFRRGEILVSGADAKALTGHTLAIPTGAPRAAP